MNLHTLREILEPRSETAASRLFDLVMQMFIIGSIVCFAIETLPDLSDTAHAYLHLAETIFVAVFTVEYLLRVAAAPRKRDFIFSFWGLIDLMAILPFYLAMGMEFLSLRALRLFRLVRVFKLLRYSRALKHFADALEVVKEQFVLYLMATFLMIFMSSVGIYHFEHQAQPEQFRSVFHSLWWAVVTLTSVGYGDVYPITTGGRVFTGLLLPIGLGVITVPSGLIAYGLTQAHRNSAGLHPARLAHPRPETAESSLRYGNPPGIDPDRSACETIAWTPDPIRAPRF
ncbi:MAG: ion transporter [Planctomycetes bacterium]|nr:ion transporter [Planctomycetota bacterium]